MDRVSRTVPRSSEGLFHDQVGSRKTQDEAEKEETRGVTLCSPVDRLSSLHARKNYAGGGQACRRKVEGGGTGFEVERGKAGKRQDALGARRPLSGLRNGFAGFPPV
jgi:hypothetical protein